MVKGFAEFKKEVSENQEFFAKYQEILQKLIDNKAAENDGELVVLAAKELGYDITLAELERDLASVQELDLDEMEAVNGGAGDSGCTINWDIAAQDEHGHNNWCLTLWHCAMVTCHTETDSKKVACFTNYKCSAFFEDNKKLV